MLILSGDSAYNVDRTGFHGPRRTAGCSRGVVPLSSDIVIEAENLRGKARKQFSNPEELNVVEEPRQMAEFIYPS